MYDILDNFSIHTDFFTVNPTLEIAFPNEILKLCGH